MEPIKFTTQDKDIVINLQERKICSKEEKKELKKKFILIEAYGKGCENQHYMMDRNEYNHMELMNNLSEYDLKSRIFTIILPNKTELKAVISQVQRQTMAELNNKITLIHLDFHIISDKTELKKHPVTTYIINKENSQDYKNGCVLHLKRHVFYHKKSGESITSIPVKAFVDLSTLSKANSISYQNQCIASLTKR